MSPLTQPPPPPSEPSCGCRALPEAALLSCTTEPQQPPNAADLRALSKLLSGNGPRELSCLHLHHHHHQDTAPQLLLSSTQGHKGFHNKAQPRLETGKGSFQWLETEK